MLRVIEAGLGPLSDVLERRRRRWACTRVFWGGTLIFFSFLSLSKERTCACVRPCALACLPGQTTNFGAAWRTRASPPGGTYAHHVCKLIGNMGIHRSLHLPSPLPLFQPARRPPKHMLSCDARAHAGVRASTNQSGACPCVQVSKVSGARENRCRGTRARATACVAPPCS